MLLPTKAMMVNSLEKPSFHARVTLVQGAVKKMKPVDNRSTTNNSINNCGNFADSQGRHGIHLEMATFSTQRCTSKGQTRKQVC